MENILTTLKQISTNALMENLVVGISIRFIILLCIIKMIRVLSRFIEKKLSEKIANKKQVKQIFTIIATMRSIIITVVLALCIIEILPKLGIDIRPILTAAGVLGIAVGLGSKQFIEDVIGGISLILSGQIMVGDIIEIDGKLGIVEKLNLKMVVLRDWDGKVYYIRNGMINVVTNYTRDYAFAIVEIGISYNENADNIMKIVSEVANNELRKGELGKYILGDLEVWGIDSFQDSSVNLKFRLKTKTMQQWKVKREFNRLIKNKFDELGIEMPFPQRTVHIESNVK